MEEFKEQGWNYKYLKYSSVITSLLQNVLPTIFYAQFSYLYSLRPSTFDKNTLKQLVSESLTRNKKEIKKVYKALKQNQVTYFNSKTMQLMNYNNDTKQVYKIADATDFRN
jgi:hypothetical protein